MGTVPLWISNGLKVLVVKETVPVIRLEIKNVCDHVQKPEGFNRCV